uniref:U6 snRNA-associated Sm-like protein LSm8 n=1 Tax=Timema monikensis TaxID=170555 RepID=A0A7R9HS84_9NEOP|nr:unnamed protein product [Timema monikensis]
MSSPGQFGLQRKSQVLNTVHPSDLFSKQLKWGRPVEPSFPCEEHCCALLHVNTCPLGGPSPLQLRQGTLKGFDQTINLILDESHERVYSTTQGVEQVVLGLHIIRGDNIAVVGELDDNMDSRLDLSSIRAEPLNSVVH